MQSFKLFMRLRPYFQVRWKKMILAYLLNFSYMGMQLLQPLIFSVLIDKVLVGRETGWLLPLLAAFLGMSVTGYFLVYAAGGLFRNLSMRQAIDLRKVLISHIRKIPLWEIEKEGVGKYTALLGIDVVTMSNFLHHVLSGLISQIFMMAVAFTVLFVMDWRIGIFTIVIVPVLIWSPRLYRKALNYYINISRTSQEEAASALMECVEGSREIRVLGLEAWEEQRYESIYESMVHSATKETLVQIKSYQTSSFIISLFIVLVYWIGSEQVLSGALSLGMMVAAVTYINNALGPVQVINNLFGELQTSEVAMERIENFLLTPWDTHEQKAALGSGGASEHFELQEDDHTLQAASPRLEVTGLCISSGDTPILEEVSFQLEKGSLNAFVGRSGSGKTTLFKALMGFVPMNGGDIRIGGVSIREMSRAELNQRICMAFQEAFLFKGTLYENIAIGNLNASEEEVYEAACQANLKDFVDELPEGLYTMVDPKGAQLSGGQRQRIALARVLLRNPDILILDEPVSALDPLTEMGFIRMLTETLGDKTILVSTHRLKSVMHADRIIVMEGGRVVEEGSHAELLEQRGLYYSLADTGEAGGEEVSRLKGKVLQPAGKVQSGVWL